jgi:hypothetical protein
MIVAIIMLWVLQAKVQSGAGGGGGWLAAGDDAGQGGWGAGGDGGIDADLVVLFVVDQL